MAGEEFTLDDNPAISDSLLDSVEHVESNGDPNAVSPAGAQGAYQFMPDTAKHFGIDPFDRDASREAARKYLTQMNDHFGDTDLALAGYNWGPGHIDRLLKAGYTKDDILAQAPKETQDYVKKVNGHHASGEFTLDEPSVKNSKNEFTLDDNEFSLDGTEGFTPMADLTGGLKAVGDLATPLVGGVVGGLHGLGDLATGQGLDKAVEDIQNTSSKFNFGTYITDPVERRAYEEASSPVKWLLDKAYEAGGKVTDLTGSPALGTAVNVGLQVGVPILGGKALGVASRASIRVPERINPKEIGRPDAVVDDLVNRKSETPTEAPAEKPAVPGTQGELDLEPPSQPVYEKPGTLFDPENIAKNDADSLEAAKAEDAARTEQRDAVLEKAFPQDHPALDVLGEEYDKALEQRDQQTNAQDPLAADVDEYQPSQQAPNQTPMKFRGPRGQRGAVGDLGDAERLGELVKNLINTDRNPGNIVVGDQVRMMNGKLARVAKITEDGRFQVRMDDGSLDTVPRNGINYKFQPTPALTKVFNRQRGSLDLSAFFGKSKEAPDVQYDAGTSKDIIAKTLEQSDSLGEFTDNLKYAFPKTDALRYVARAGELWNAKEQILTNHDRSTQYGSLPKATRVATADVTRTLPTMLKEEKLTKPLKTSDDIGRVARYGNVAPVQVLMHKGPAGSFIRWVFSNTHEITNQSLKMFKDLTQHFDNYRDIGRKSRARITSTAIKFDGLKNDLLKDQGLQWPTEDMLRQEGLNDAEVRAYKQITLGLDKMFDISEQRFLAEGREPPPRIPGWFPHQWVGAYKVILSKDGTDVHMEAFPNRRAAQSFLNKAKYDFEARLEEPKAEVQDNQLASTIMQALEVYKNRTGLNKVLIDKLNNLEQWNQRGIIKELLERKANISGHEASKDLSDSVWDTEHNSRLLSAYLKSAEDVSKYWANSRITKEVLQPLSEQRELLKDTPNLLATLEEHIGRSTGHMVNHIKFVDETARAIGIKLGQDPQMISNTMGALGRSMQWMKLIFPNPAFVFVNTFQALTGLDRLAAIHAERINAGLPTANVVKSTGVLFREWLSATQQGQWSPEYKSALKWLKDNNKIDTYQIDLIDPTQGMNIYEPVERNLLKKIPTKIEEHNRTALALSFYSYFREIMPKREALEASALHMDTVMGNYTPSQSAGMFSDFGMIGKGARVFHLLANTIIGRMAMNIKLIGEGMKTGDPIKATASLAPFATMLATFYYTAGLMGLPGFQEWDAIARELNTTFNLDLPRPAALLRKYGAKTENLYGMVSSLVGVNVGTSMNSPALSGVGALPWLDQAAAILKLGRAAATKLLGGTPNMNDIYQAGRAILPPLAIPQMEKYFASKNHGVYPNTTNVNQGEYKRSPEEQRAVELTGRRTITEQNQRDINSLEKYYKNVDAAWKSSQMDKLYQIISGMNPTFGKTRQQAALDFAREMAKAKRGFTPQEIITGLKAREETANIPAHERSQQQIMKSTNPAEKARRIQIMRDIEHVFQQTPQ